MKRAAMTLIELLVALSLSAMLMAVLFTMLGQHKRTSARLMKSRPFEPWKIRLKEQIQADYFGCRHVQVSNDRIVFDGYSKSSDSALSGPSRIVWYIIPNEQGNWLFRERRDLLSTQPSRQEREYVCKGVNQFKSLTQLSTDVAPGFLRLSVAVDSAIDRDKENDEEETAVNQLELVLVRHGGSP